MLAKYPINDWAGFNETQKVMTGAFEVIPVQDGNHNQLNVSCTDIKLTFVVVVAEGRPQPTL